MFPVFEYYGKKGLDGRQFRTIKREEAGAVVRSGGFDLRCWGETSVDKQLGSLRVWFDGDSFDDGDLLGTRESEEREKEASGSADGGWKAGEPGIPRHSGTDCVLLFNWLLWLRRAAICRTRIGGGW